MYSQNRNIHKTDPELLFNLKIKLNEQVCLKNAYTI